MMMTRLTGSLVCLLLLGCNPGAAGDENEGDENAATSESSSETSSETSETGSETALDDTCVEPIVIEGDVSIYDTSEIAEYDCVVEITGSLHMSWKVDVTVLDGFPRLERVGGVMSLDQMPNLVSITGFPELREVGALSLRQNLALTSIEGFAKLERITGSLYIEEHPLLVSIEGFAMLESVGLWFYIRNAPLLETLAPLRVTSLGELYIIGCHALENLAGFEQLTVLPRTEIDSNQGLLSLDGLEQVTAAEALALVDNDALTDITALGGLGLVEGDLRIAGNGSLASLAGVEGITVVLGNFDIVDNDALLDLPAPEFPMSISGHVQICENGSLAALPDAMQITATGTAASVIRNASLPNADALAFVTAIGHPDARVAANEDFGDFPLDVCPWIADGICDESERYEGDVEWLCDPQTGDGCCEMFGPTGLCAADSDAVDCPAAGGGPWD